MDEEDLPRPEWTTMKCLVNNLNQLLMIGAFLAILMVVSFLFSGQYTNFSYEKTGTMSNGNKLSWAEEQEGKHNLVDSR